MSKHHLSIDIIETSESLRQYANQDGVMVWRQSDDGQSLWPIDLNPTRPITATCHIIWEVDDIK
jgi:hypothetical protein